MSDDPRAVPSGSNLNAPSPTPPPPDALPTLAPHVDTDQTVIHGSKQPTPLVSWVGTLPDQLPWLCRIGCGPMCGVVAGRPLQGNDWWVYHRRWRTGAI